MTIALLGAVAVIVAIAIIVGIILYKSMYQVASPDEALIITGKSKKGKTVPNPEAGGDPTDLLAGQRIVVGSGTLVKPMVERVHRMSLRSHNIPLNVNGVVSLSNIPLTIEATAVVKVGGTEKDIRAAAQRFLGQQDDIKSTAQDVLNGNLRSIIGQMSVDQILQNREELASRVQNDTADAMGRQGLVIDTLQINSVTDSMDYILNLSRPDSARVEREARIAEAQNRQTAAEKESEADQKVADSQRDLDLHKAQIEAETSKAKAEAEAAGRSARAQADERVIQEEERVAERRAQLKERELDTEVRKPADAAAYKLEAEAKADARVAELNAEAELNARRKASEARTLEGKAEADVIRSRGEAEADSMQKQADAYAQYGQAAVLEMALKAMPEVVGRAAEAVKGIDNMTVVSKDGSTGVASMVTDLLMESSALLKSQTGLDLTQMIADATGQGDSVRSREEAVVKASSEDAPSE